ncbi:MAG TPA: hypothetical protein VF069_15860 [Streptosporangiaceae bacterium]
MRPARITAVALGLAVPACAGAPAAVAETIVVSPSHPHPGQKVHIIVPGCSVGPTPHTARSAAFTHEVTLYGKADTGEGDPRIRRGLRPGTYPIIAFCGGTRAVHGEVHVVAGGRGTGSGYGAPGPAGSPPPRVTSISASPAASSGAGGPGGSEAPYYWALGAAVVVLGGGAGVLLLRRRANAGR